VGERASTSAPEIEPRGSAACSLEERGRERKGRDLHGGGCPAREDGELVGGERPCMKGSEIGGGAPPVRKGVRHRPGRVTEFGKGGG
jgi:hypothetical protein